MLFTDEPSLEGIVWLFSSVLGHSRMMWGRFVARQDLAAVLRCLVAAFEAFGGVPKQILYDRMKTAALGDVDERGIVYNEKLLDLAAHYGTAAKAYSSYPARTKGKVEPQAAHRHRPPLPAAALQQRYAASGGQRPCAAGRRHRVIPRSLAIYDTVGRRLT